MPKQIKLKYDNKLKSHYIDINELSDFIDIKSIESYDLEVGPNNEIRVIFFDKENKVILPKG